MPAHNFLSQMSVEANAVNISVYSLIRTAAQSISFSCTMQVLFLTYLLYNDLYSIFSEQFNF